MNLLGSSSRRSDGKRKVAHGPATRWLVSGVVQGVGFRPFVYRLAREHRLKGWVRNCVGQVEIVASGTADQLQAFARGLVQQAPAIAHPVISHSEPLDGVTLKDFRILASETARAGDIHVPPDYFVCEDCLAELDDPHNRRYRYPFINCTQCGPRYTLIEALPYDRANTSMAHFDLCPDCLQEYTDISNRRFHAEPVACGRCGPALFFRQAALEITDSEAALAACVSALRAGRIVAVKGVGGYHLMCNATDQAVVQRLRENKSRPHKPLALMFPVGGGLAELTRMVTLSAAEKALLCTPERPIVLAAQNTGNSLPQAIAPGLSEIGVMLPYSPLHHLLLNEFGGPLVATSANISGEPVLTENARVEQRLGAVADAFLHHDRPIVRPADDSVYRSLLGKPRPMRLGRGHAPTEFKLPGELKQPVLAVGGHTKNTICLAWGERAVMSPHLGDMGSARSLQVFEQLIDDLQRLYDVRAEVIVCDAHPAYVTSRWARRQGLPLVEVQHHAAHASALLGEQAAQVQARHLVFTWDGVGYGDDGTLWGGEALYGVPGQWRRVASMRPFRLSGGEKAGREPWRSAVSLAWECGADSLAMKLIDSLGAQPGAPSSYELLYQAWQKNLNTPTSTAVGRLFDAAAALTGRCVTASFEGQGPMWLEAVADGPADPVNLPLLEQSDGLLCTDWQPLVKCLGDEQIPVSKRAAIFHTTMAEALVDQALRVREGHALQTVGLCGGVFQNRRLTEECVSRLEQQGFTVLLGERLPVNDAGLSFGQLVEYLSCHNSGMTPPGIV
ncbi:MAG: carbamoyltransferase HypF [Thiogranum sp.]